MSKSLKKEKIAYFFLSIAAMITVLSLILIVFYIVKNGFRALSLNFLLENPRKMGSEGGIFPAILGTIYLVITTVLIATPLGVGAAIYLNEFTRENGITKLIRFSTEVLAGVPSIIFGLFGFALFVIYLKPLTGGWSIISASLTGVTMILPTIIRTSEEALKAVPDSLREGSLALGATRWQTIKRIILPSALPGILTGLILSIGRVVGETAAFLLTMGGSLLIPHSLFDGGRTLSLHLYMVAMETGAMEIAFATGTVLVIFTFLINFLANWLIKKAMARFS